MIRCVNLTTLVLAAQKHGFLVHLHQDEQGQPIYSIGCADYGGASEFDSYAEALAWVEGWAKA